MTRLTSSRIDEIVDTVCPKAPLFVPDPSMASPGMRIVDKRGQVMKCGWGKSTALNLGAPDVALIGGVCVGDYPTTKGWQDLKSTGTGDDFIRWDKKQDGRVELIGAVTYNGHDDIAPPKSKEANATRMRWVLKHHLSIFARDEVIEDDACLGGEIYDSLFDNCWNVVSQRNPNNDSGFKYKNNPTKIRRLLARMACQPDPRTGKNSGNTCPSSKWGGGARITKGGGATGPWDMAESLILWQTNCNRGTSPMRFYPGSYRDCYVIYCRDQKTPSANFPGGKLPSGVTLLSEENAMDVWHEARRRWYLQHNCNPGNATFYGTTYGIGGGSPFRAIPEVVPMPPIDGVIPSPPENGEPPTPEPETKEPPFPVDKNNPATMQMVTLGKPAGTTAWDIAVTGYDLDTPGELQLVVGDDVIEMVTEEDQGQGNNQQVATVTKRVSEDVFDAGENELIWVHGGSAGCTVDEVEITAVVGDVVTPPDPGDDVEALQARIAELEEANANLLDDLEASEEKIASAMAVLSG